MPHEDAPERPWQEPGYFAWVRHSISVRSGSPAFGDSPLWVSLSLPSDFVASANNSLCRRCTAIDGSEPVAAGSSRDFFVISDESS